MNFGLGVLVGAGGMLLICVIVMLLVRVKRLEQAQKARLPYDKMEDAEDLLAMLNSLTWDKETRILRDQQELERIQKMWKRAAKLRAVK